MIYSGLGKGFYAVVTARFVNRFGDFVHFLLVLFLSIKLGLSDRAVGLVSTLVFIFTFSGQALSAFLADRISRSYLLPLFQLLIAICYLLILPFIGISNIAVIALILVSSIFRGAAFPITNALVSDLVKEDRRRDAYSLLYLVTNIGVASGSIIAGLLFRSINLLFIISALMLLSDSLIIKLFVPYIKPVRKKGERKMENDRTFIVFILLLSAIGFFYNFMYQSTFFALPLEMKSIYGDELGPSYYSYISMINALSVIVLTSLITMLTSKRRSITNIVTAMILYSLGLLLFFFSRTMPFFGLSMIIWTSGEILMATNINAYLNNNVPDKSRGFFNSVYLCLESLGGAAAPALAGLILSFSGYCQIWMLLSLLSLLIAASYHLLGKHYV